MPHRSQTLSISPRSFGACPCLRAQSDDFGLSVCLLVACPFLVAAAMIAYRLPDPPAPSSPGATPALGDQDDQCDKHGELGLRFSNLPVWVGKPKGSGGTCVLLL